MLGVCPKCLSKNVVCKTVRTSPIVGFYSRKWGGGEPGELIEFQTWSCCEFECGFECTIERKLHRENVFEKHFP